MHSLEQTHTPFLELGRFSGQKQELSTFNLPRPSRSFGQSFLPLLNSASSDPCFLRSFLQQLRTFLHFYYCRDAILAVRFRFNTQFAICVVAEFTSDNCKICTWNCRSPPPILQPLLPNSPPDPRLESGNSAFSYNYRTPPKVEFLWIEASILAARMLLPPVHYGFNRS